MGTSGWQSIERLYENGGMVIGPGMCAMWHQDPRPMLRAATLDEAGPQVSYEPPKSGQVLCDDGEWRYARIEARHEGVLGWEYLISWHGSPVREYTGWFGYSPTALRLGGG